VLADDGSVPLQNPWPLLDASPSNNGLCSARHLLMIPWDNEETPTGRAQVPFNWVHQIHLICRER